MTSVDFSKFKDFMEIDDIDTVKFKVDESVHIFYIHKGIQKSSHYKKF